MYFCFSSVNPAVLKIDGVYFGSCHENIKSCNISSSNLPYVEICPLNNCGLPLSFFPNEEFLNSPPKSVVVTDLKGGYLIKYFNEKISSEFKIIAQEKSSYSVVTLFNENGNKLSIETPTDFYTENFDFFVSSAKFQSVTVDGKTLLAVIIYSIERTFFNIYDLGEKTNKLLSEEVQSFSLDNEIKITKEYGDIAKHKVTLLYGYKNNSLYVKDKTVSSLRKITCDSLIDEIIPFAFLEALMVGDSISEFLSDKILSSENKLSGFFGNFIGVFPPPEFHPSNQVGLVYRIKDNLYKTEYFTFSIENKKITSIKKV